MEIHKLWFWRSLSVSKTPPLASARMAAQAATSLGSTLMAATRQHWGARSIRCWSTSLDMEMDWKEDIPGAQLAGIAGMGYSPCYILFSVCIYSHDIPMIYPYFWLNHPWQPKRNISAGETVFYAGNGTKEVLRVVPNTGMALVHRHGRECLLHESLPVRSGVKQLGAKRMGWFQGKSSGMNSCCSLLSSGRFRFSCRFCLKPLGNAWLMRKGSQKTFEIGGMVGISGAEFTASDQIVLGDVDED